MYRQVSRVVKGPDGTPKRDSVKKEYFVCDLGIMGGGRLNQTRLSFSLVLRPEAKPEDQKVIDTRNTHSEGQQDSTADTRAGINSDEKDLYDE